MRFPNHRDSELTRLPGDIRVYEGYVNTIVPRADSMDAQCRHKYIAERRELKRIRPEKNERRFYVLEVTRDLFGGLSLSRTWGRIGKSGRQRFDQHHSLDDALTALSNLSRAKEKRGYQASANADERTRAVRVKFGTATEQQ
ncbi:MAG: WGR domain-containing protein [Acidocella sp.]|nr:WGR domain-containing protein [Acidocella sp.]